MKKTQFITLPQEGKVKPFIYPSALTRYYLRYDLFVSSFYNIKLFIEYDFAFDLFVGGVKIKLENLKEVDISAYCKNGKNEIAMRLYLSNKPMSFIPALFMSVFVDGEFYIDTSSKDFVISTFPAFYTTKEDENWQINSFKYNSAQIHSHHPKDILRSFYTRKNFNISGDIKIALVKLYARGMYEAYINGEKVSNAVLSPGVVSATENGYPHKASEIDYFQEYDITKFLLKGKNVISAVLGNGWYSSEGFNTMRIASPEFTAEIEIHYKSGVVKYIRTDENWYAISSPILENDLQYGERYDANLEIKDWKNIDCNLKNWKKVSLTTTKLKNLIKQPFKDIEIVERIQPIAVLKNELGDIYDFGCNISGRTETKFKNLDKNKIVTLRYAEKLGSEGGLCAGAYHDVLFAIDTHWGEIAEYGAKNIDSYKSNGEKEQTFSPKFSYTGFRYVQVIGAKDIEITALKMRTNEPIILKIKTSNNLINKICEASINSFSSNLFCGLTDCPQREKNFWNGDVSIMASTMFYICDCHNLMSYWTRFGRKISSNAVCWQDEIIETPYNLYKFYNDIEILAYQYEAMKTLVDTRIKLSKNGEYKGEDLSSYGDHARPSGVDDLDSEFLPEMYFFRSVNRLKDISKILGKEEEYNYYSKIEIEIKNWFSDSLYEKILNKDLSSNMTYFILPVAFNLCDDIQREKIIKKLVEALKINDFTIRCGVIGASEILKVLSNNNYHDIAFSVATCTKYPSFGNMILSGATTTTEYWAGLNSSEEGDSFNHYFFGTYISFVVENICGLSPQGISKAPNMFGLTSLEVNYRDINIKI